jgi:hypothetical protein
MKPVQGRRKIAAAAFDTEAFMGGLASKGIVLGLYCDAFVRASGLSELSEEDQKALSAHKSEIVKFLLCNMKPVK